MDDLQKAFRDIFNQNARPFQLRVANHLLNGKSVILRAPTGSGKTFTALFPYMYAVRHDIGFPRQLLYSLPLRVLANSLCKTTKEVAKKHQVTLQTGEMPEDPQFLIGDFIFMTYDQTLTSFLNFPFSLGRRQANVNAGALISSYLVFDEVHLMEMQRALGTTVEMLKWMKSTTPFLIMTATLTNSTIEWIREETGAEVVELSEEEIINLPKPRIWKWSDEPITVEDICNEHDGKTIVVVNQVERAQELFLALKTKKEEDTADNSLKETDLILLHSRFTSKDRKEKSQKIEEKFGKNAVNTNCILVATQVIEVGLDISATRLHTEIAPANSLVQRAGRCARFGGEGIVFVYDVKKEKSSPYLPYDSVLCEKTKTHIGAVVNEKASFVGYVEELCFVKTVHDTVDIQAISDLKKIDRAKQIQNAITERDTSYYRELVRDIDAVSVVIGDAPIKKFQPFTLEAFSLSSKILLGAYSKTQESTKVFAWWPKERATDELDDEKYKKTIYDWEPVNCETELTRAMQIAINPAFANYDSDLGLQLLKEGNYTSAKIVKKYQTESFGYTRETYEEHIHLVWLSYKSRFEKWKRLDFVSRRLEHSLGLPVGTIEKLIKFVIACHDAAKLTKNWQCEVNKYQIAIGGNPARHNEFLAHTDHDPKNSVHIEEEKKCKRPPHAAESAILTCRAVTSYLSAELPTEILKKIMGAYIIAISTHHSPGNRQCSAQKLMPGASEEIYRVIQAVSGLSLPAEFTNDLLTEIQETKGTELSKHYPRPQSDGDYYLLAMILTRALRISDQHSFEEKTKCVPTTSQN